MHVKTMRKGEKAVEKKQKAETPVDRQDKEAIFRHLNAVASSTECTGLIPTPATDEAELDSYSDIYDVPLADSPKDQFEDMTHYPERP